MPSDLIVDFPAQARRKVVRSKPNKKMVHFSSEYDIRFYERPDKVHASELYYSREDISQFKVANRQAILDIHMRRLTSVNGADLTGNENLLTPGLTKKAMARKMGYRNAVLDEQERHDASGYHDPGRLARAAENYSRWATRRALKIAIMNHTSVTVSSMA